MSGFERGDYGVLSDLHRQIMEKFTYMTDQEKYGMVEMWGDSTTLKNIGRSGVTKFTGDCEEFALVSAAKAQEHGYHARIVVCYVETGEGHAICEIASKDYAEAYFFDNRQHKVVVAEELLNKKYRFIAVSPWNPTPHDDRPWLKVQQ